MKKTIIWITVSVLLLLGITIGTVCGVLSSKKIDGGYAFAAPDSFLIYSPNSRTAVEFKSNDEKFQEIYQLFLNSGKSNRLNEMFSQGSFKTGLRINREETEKRFLDLNKQDFICLEFSYGEKVQTVIATDNGNTRIVDFVRLIFIVSDQNGFLETEIYYSDSHTGEYERMPLHLYLQHSNLRSWLLKNI